LLLSTSTSISMTLNGSSMSPRSHACSPRTASQSPRTISTPPTIAWIAGSSPQRWRISRSST
jgi:hypothetical protein